MMLEPKSLHISAWQGHFSPGDFLVKVGITIRLQVVVHIPFLHCFFNTPSLLGQ